MELQITEATYFKYARNAPKLMQMHRALAILLLFAYAIEILGYLLTALLPCSNLTPSIEKSRQREKLSWPFHGPMKLSATVCCGTHNIT